jgi:hypothetical protein
MRRGLHKRHCVEYGAALDNLALGDLQTLGYPQNHIGHRHVSEYQEVGMPFGLDDGVALNIRVAQFSSSLYLQEKDSLALGLFYLRQK